jgi:hypothetical protein
MTSKTEFMSWVYNLDTEEEDAVDVNIISYYAGCKATYWEPGDDPEIEIAVFRDTGDCIFDTLDGETQERLIDEAWEHLKSWYED